MKNFILFFLLFSFFNNPIFCQEETVIDEIIAIVGENYILKSELEIQYLQYASQLGGTNKAEIQCQLLNQLLLQKMMITQAEIDSIEISDSQVDDELERRLRYFINQFGSEKNLEEYYKKSIIEIKEEFRPSIKEQLIVQKMQSTITNDVNVIPSEVKEFYKNIPKDSIPFINASVEVGQIVKLPAMNVLSKEETRNKLKDLRQKIVEGENFEKIAKIYSEDPGSAQRGGELGFIGRGELVKEFEAVAFKLSKEELSNVFETEYGFHIVQLIEKRGEQVNVRHILLKPQLGLSDIETAKVLLDSIFDLIKKDSLSFEKAASHFSDDEQTKQNGGMLFDSESSSNQIPMDKIDPQLFFQLDTLKPGAISTPLPYKTKDGKEAYRIIYYKSKTPPHRANLKDDYQILSTATLTQKKEEEFQKWFLKKKGSTYIQIDKEFQVCEIMQNWLK